MAVFRVEKTRDYTVMANHHLKNRALTLKAKGLLSLMLSLPEDWDYTLKGLSLISVESIDAIRQAVRELESAGYIVRSRERNEKGQLKGAEYVIYEQPHLSDKPPVPEKPTLGNPTLDNPTQEKPVLGTPALGQPTQGNPTQLNTNRSNTYSSNTQKLNTDSSTIHPSINQRPEGAERETGMDAMDTMDAYRRIIHRNIEYDCLIQQYGRERMDEIVELMLEAVCLPRSHIRVGGEEIPEEVVKSRLLKLNSTHIQYVFDCIDKNTTKVRNIRGYLLTTLYNAPATIDHYYRAEVNHDMYGGPY